jgi:Transposase DDE domain
MGRSSSNPGRWAPRPVPGGGRSSTTTGQTGPDAPLKESISRSRAERAVAGKTTVKRNRFVQLTGATKTINRSLEAKARAQAGLKGYVTNLEAPTAEHVMAAYHQLWQIEKSFRMSKSDLRARPIYHHKRDSIEAHLTIVMAALAVSQWLERHTSWSIKKLVKALRRYRSIAVQTGDHILHAGTPLDDDTRAAVRAIKNAAAGH